MLATIAFNLQQSGGYQPASVIREQCQRHLNECGEFAVGKPWIAVGQAGQLGSMCIAQCSAQIVQSFCLGETELQRRDGNPRKLLNHCPPFESAQRRWEYRRVTSGAALLSWHGPYLVWKS